MSIEQDITEHITKVCQHELGVITPTLNLCAKKGTMWVTPRNQINVEVEGPGSYQISIYHIWHGMRIPIIIMNASGSCPTIDRAMRECFKQDPLGVVPSFFRFYVEKSEDSSDEDIIKNIQNRYAQIYSGKITLPESIIKVADNHRELVTRDAYAYFSEGQFRLVPAYVQCGWDKRLYKMEDIKHMLGASQA